MVEEAPDVIGGLTGHQSEECYEGHLLGRLTGQHQIELFDQLFAAREAELLHRYGPFAGPEGDGPKRVLSVGCGPRPCAGVPDVGHYVVGLDSEPAHVEEARRVGKAQEVHLGIAQKLPFDNDSFDALIYRLVLHHLVYQGSLLPIFEEARRVLKPGGSVIVVEPSIFNPIGFLLAAANKLRLSRLVHGTSDDCPLSPLRMRCQLQRLGFDVQVFGLEYSWRRLPVAVQKLMGFLSFMGATPILKLAAHTFLLIGKKKFV